MEPPRRCRAAWVALALLVLAATAGGQPSGVLDTQGAASTFSPPLSLRALGALLDTGHAGLKAVPGVGLKVEWPVQGLTVKEGAELQPSMVARPPTVTVSAPPGSLYALALVDPDAPFPEAPRARSWLHWLLVNCRPGAAGAAGNCDVLVPYAGPTPPGGKHRYVFLAYLQPAKIKAAPIAQRGSFSPASWAAASLGAGHARPAAVTLFYASPEIP